MSMLLKNTFCSAGFATVLAAGVFAGSAQAALQLHYTFDDDTLAAGGITDQSGQGHHGSAKFSNDHGATGTTVGDFVAFSSDTRNGSGQSLQLTAGGSMNGDVYQDGGYVESDTPGYAGITGNGARTVFAWIKPASAVEGEIVTWGTGSNGGRFSFRLDDNGSGDMVLRVEIDGDGYTGDEVIIDSEDNTAWTSVALSYSGGDFGMYTAYVNGVEDFNTVLNDAATDTTANDQVRVGRRSNREERYFDGLMDDIAIWDEELSGEQILALHNGAPIPEPGSLVLLGLGGLCLLGRCRRAKA